MVHDSKHDSKIVGHRHPGIYAHIWARYLTDRQLRREIRAILRVSGNLNRTTNQALDLLLQEAEGRQSMKDWLTRCLEMLAANAAEEAGRAAEANTITSLAQHDQATS